MKYRTFGRTGEEVSEIGLGGHREGVEVGAGLAGAARYFVPAQDRARVVGRAIDQGVTYFDTTWGCEIESLGESLRILNRRDGLFVSGMRVDFFSNLLREKADPRAFARSEVEGRLREFGIDHIDQFMLGALEGGDPLSHSPAIMEDVLGELARLRDEGKIRYAGFSCHDPDYAARLIETWPAFDAVMTPYNFVNRAAEGKLAEALRTAGTAWIAMKPMVWHAYGLPVTTLRNIRPVSGRAEHDPQAPIAALALQFILSNPLIATTVPSVNSIEAVDENTAASNHGKLTNDDVGHLQSYADSMEAENLIPLAIGGLLEDNLRVRSFAIGVITGRLGLACGELAADKDDAEERARKAADDLLAHLAEDAEWSPYIP